MLIMTFNTVARCHHLQLLQIIHQKFKMSLYKRPQSDKILWSTYSIAVVSDHIQREVVSFFVNVTQQRKTI